MHPIERLRFVARAAGAPVDDLVGEAAASLAGFADEPAALVTACRRLVQRHRHVGPVWWLAARTLASPEPADEPWRCRDAYGRDPSAADAIADMDEGATVAVLGWPDRFLDGFGRRGDLRVLVVDVEGDGPGFTRALERADVTAVDVGFAGLAAAVAAADLLLLDPSMIGPDGALAPPGSWAAAAVAAAAGVPVVTVGGVGRVLPAGLWAAATGVFEGTPAWERTVDLVPPALLGTVDHGVPDCPDVPELRR